ncbi:MAG: TonB-dependent receptor [Pseudomonadota bacterium]
MINTKSKMLLTTAAWVASLSALSTASIAAAQDEPQARTGNLDTIVVTATRREESLQDVPVAVTAVSGETLLAAGIDSVELLSNIAPSVTFTQSSNDLNNAINIRGIGTSVFSQGVEPSVSVVVDDVVMARQGMGFQDLIDIERVEVLRGPQSTLFGKNASAGVISVTTQEPSEEFTANLDATYAELNEVAVRGSVSGPISDTVGVRLTGYVRQRDGHIENVADNRDFNGFENWGLRGKLLFRPTDQLDVTLIADYRETEQDCCIYTVRDTSQAVGAAANGNLDALIAPVVASESNDQVNVNAPIFNNSEQGGVSLKAEYDLSNDYTVTSISAWRAWDFENNLDVDNLSLEDPVPGFITFDLNSGTTKVDQYSQEFRITSPNYDKYDFVLGAYGFYLDLDRTFQRRFEIAIPLQSGGIFQLNQSGQFESSVKTTNLALFGSGNYYLTDKITLFGGARAIYEELDYDLLRDPANVVVDGDSPFGGGTGTFADIDDTTDDTALTGDVGVRYDITESAQVYARYARGYKGQAIDVGFGASPDVEPIDPETSDAFELGFKSVLANNNLILNVALFHTTYDNFQEQAAVLVDDGGELNSETLLTNVGTVRTQGVEVEFTATPTSTTTIQGGVSYTDAEITDFDGAPCYFGQTEAQGCIDNPATANADPTQDASGGDLPNAPDWRLTGSIRQEVPISGAPFDGFIQANARWQSETLFALNQDPATVQESFAIVNLAVGVEDKSGRYYASLFVNNLFDEFYTTNIFGDPLFGGVVSQYVPRDSERYFGGRVGVNF